MTTTVNDAAVAPAETPGPVGFRRLVSVMGWPYFVASALARLPQSMLTIGALTYVAAGADDFTTPGAVAAISGVGVGLGAPIMGAASDRWGQRKVLLVSTVAYVLALVGLLWAGSPRDGIVHLDLPLGAFAVLAGMVVPQIGPMTRVRWMRRLTGARDRSSVDLAMGYESTVDEMGYVFGPALVGIVAAAAGAPIPLVIADRVFGCDGSCSPCWPSQPSPSTAARRRAPRCGTRRPRAWPVRPACPWASWRWASQACSASARSSAPSPRR